MSFNYKHSNLPKQTQEILRQKARSEEIKREAERRKDQIKLKILKYLGEFTRPRLLTEIANAIKIKNPDISPILRELVKEGKIQKVIVKDEDSENNSPRYCL
ncbi:hypothetical protein QUF84_00210 [Fictibacillus enclensis]|uniref:hypothetical protein n=1 Tax=Fictibacillus enclensis TaxID=1017270 RepID=UPI00259FFCA4|nr:hypothetical protein [Fictibacillus enclensis]MDM5335719.1 hypothetical protein [Fictibacillus enclensis]